MKKGLKVALVTGAGSGIGKAVALRLRRDGYSVALAGRRRDPLQSVADEPGDWTGDAYVHPVDIGEAAAVGELFDAVKSRFGRLDLLFNNAGTGSQPLPIDEIAIEDWQNVVNVNLNGAFYCARHAFRLMRNQQPGGGRIINNGSISAHAPRLFSAPYTATKHAITGLTKSLALDGRQFDIACGQIDIGNAATPMTARMSKGVLQADGTVQVEPTMDVAHVADTVAHMASLPLDANIPFVTVMATQMPYIGRG